MSISSSLGSFLQIYAAPGRLRKIFSSDFFLPFVRRSAVVITFPLLFFSLRSSIPHVFSKCLKSGKIPRERASDFIQEGI
jgi:hypothetical protein